MQAYFFKVFYLNELIFFFLKIYKMMGQQLIYNINCFRKLVTLQRIFSCIFTDLINLNDTT